MLKFGMTPVMGDDEEDDGGKLREIMEKENVASNQQAEARHVFFFCWLKRLGGEFCVKCKELTEVKKWNFLQERLRFKFQ
jgi:hypothetical protein